MLLYYVTMGCHTIQKTAGLESDVKLKKAIKN